jgi:hypothetical protein
VPSGVSCGSSCFAIYQPGTAVTLSAVPRTGSVFHEWSGDCGGSGACQLVMSGPRTATAGFVHKPDVAIKPAGSRYTGFGIYNGSGARQTRVVKAKRGATKTFFIGVRNPGTGLQTFKLKGLGSTKDFTVKYLVGTKGTGDITAKVVSGKYAFGLVPGTTRYFRMVITLKATATVGSAFGRLVTARSALTGIARDAVKGVVKVI